MTSKKASKELINYLDWSLDSQEEKEATQLLNIIKKDLEVLELLKREMFNKNKCFDLDNGWYDDSFSFSKDEQKKIKEWLEDE